MISDITETILSPGNGGADCQGNGEYFDDQGNHIECCCDACDYLLCCISKFDINACKNCTDKDCTKAGGG